MNASQNEMMAMTEVKMKSHPERMKANQENKETIAQRYY